MSKKEIKVPIFHARITVFKDTTIQEVCEQELDMEPFNGYQAGVFTIEDDRNIPEYVLVLPDDCNAGIIAHECLHLTNNVFQFIGAYPDFQNDEPHAYLHKYLVNQVTNFYKNDS